MASVFDGPFHNPLHPMLLSALIVIKIKAPELYSRMSGGVASADDVLEHVRRLPGGMDFMASRLGEVFEAFVLVALSPQWDLDVVLQRYNIHAQTEVGELAMKRALAIVQLLGEGFVRRAAGSLDYLLKKIDLVAGQ